jgi:hypothetical protein
MGNWLPWALLVLVAILLMAMPWRRPHPNHEFMLDMLRLLEDNDSNVAGCSLRLGHANADAKYRPVSPDAHR